MADKHAYLMAGKRSPVGKYLGMLSKLSAVEIGAQVGKAVLAEARAELAAFNEVFVGQVLQAGCGQNPARQVALGAGLPDTISCCTVNKVCGSGLQAVMFADQVIRAGDADLILAGGIESMSQAPYLVRTLRAGSKFGHTELVDEMLYDGLTNVYTNELMGELAEYTADKAGITRQQQDEWAVRSQQRAAQATQEGRFKAEIVPITVPKTKEPFAADETFRADTTLASLAGLKPAFKKDGTVTAGNASQLSDGAALVVVASEKGLGKCGAKPLARVVATATAGGPPRELFFTPPKAAQMVCQKAGWNVRDVEMWELNEAFASQTLAGLKALEIDTERVNVNGGAIALGHPIGASGARVLVTLLHVMKERGAKRGVTAVCLGGGNAVAMAVETV
ncbi:MAG: acetyl-CoA C-acyltransferase [Phycisphaerae bacterium]|nr:acetyl-CoA C-acyltransferase [Phycisphaerae bacterium]